MAPIWKRHFGCVSVIILSHSTFTTRRRPIQWRIQGGPIRPCPPLKLAMEFGPLGGRKSNDSIVDLSKIKNFGPPVAMSATDLPPPYEKDHITRECLKRSFKNVG